MTSATHQDTLPFAPQHAPMRVSRPTVSTQKIRVATTMTGGVSLAIWMGGVTRELNLLTQASTWRKHLPSNGQALPEIADATDPDQAVRELYLRLIDLLDVTVTTDVLSGTSAGGINAALLALSRARGVDLATLRELWIGVGSMETLLRQPTDAAFPSLMYGDQVMLQALEDNLSKLGWPTAPGLLGFDPAAWVAPHTSLFITTTLLEGETNRVTDSYGTLIQDTDHSGLFTFTERDLAKGSTDALALAARSSSSFPVAFEPSFLPFTSAIEAKKGVQHHPAMARFTNITRAHWVADGGLLANRPLQPLLEAMFNRPTDRQTRRVLLYIVPSSGDVPDPLSSLPADHFEAPLGLGTALLKELAAMLNQSISSDLRAIRDHNDALVAVTSARLRLAELGSAHPAGLLTAHLLDDYKLRAGTALVRPVVTALSRLVSTMPAPGNPAASGQPAMPDAWAEDLRTPVDTLARCQKSALAALTATWTAIPEDFPSLAGFGRSAFDGAKAIVLNILRDAFVLARQDSDRVPLADAVGAVHDAFRAPQPPDVDLLVQTEVEQNSAAHVQDLAVAAATRYQRELVTGPNPDATAQPLMEAAWHDLAEALVRADLRLSELVQAPAAPGTPRRSPTEEQAAEAVSIYLNYLFDRRVLTHAQQVQSVAARLFALHATDRALMPVVGDVQQPLELIQLSADTRTLLDPTRQTAASKLTGMQLHHFGAFFKSSWRANDWMWGRLDGAGWLVHLLLDPRRIVNIVDNNAPPGGSAADWFLRQLADRVGVGELPSGIDLASTGEDRPNRIDEQRIREELNFLDDRTLELPKSLPLTALWVAGSWQRWIAANELPELARQVDENARENHVPWAQAVLQLAPDDPLKPVSTLLPMSKLLASNPVSGETLTSAIGTPLMARTATKALATATGAIATEPHVPTAARPVTMTLRTVTLATYKIANLTDGTPRRLLIGGVVAMIVGIALAIQQSTVIGFSGTVITFAGFLVLSLGVWGLGRHAVRGILSALLALGVLILLALTAIPWSRHWLFATSTTDRGLLGRHVDAWVTWLGDAWWHPLTIVGIVAALLVIAAIIGSRSMAQHGLTQPSTQFRPSDAGVPPAVAVPAGSGGARRPVLRRSPTGGAAENAPRESRTPAG